MKQTDDLIWRIYFFTWFASDFQEVKMTGASPITASLEEI